MLVDVRHVEVVVLNRLWHVVRGKFVAQLIETRAELLELVDLLFVEWQVAVQQLVVAG